MSLTIVKAPTKSVNGHLSKWSAVHHGIEFEIQRKDATVTMKLLSGVGPSAAVKIKISGSIPSSVAVGQTIYYCGPIQKYFCQITAISGNWITTNLTAPGSYSGGFVNFVDAYKNYYIDTKIFGVNDSGQYIEIGTSRNKPNPTGLIKVNVHKWLKTVAVYRNEFLYNAINKAIIGEGSKFSIRYRENFNGLSTSFSGYSAVSYWSNSAKQIQDIFGSNMGEFVPTLDDTRAKRAKFLSVFEKPTYFVGFPFSLSFIYSDNLLNLQVKRMESTKDLNGTQIALTNTNLNATQRFSVNRLMLKEDYISAVKTLEVWLETGDAIIVSPLDNGVYSDGTIFNPFLPVDHVKPLVDLPIKTE